MKTFLKNAAASIGVDVRRLRPGTDFARRRHELMAAAGVTVALDVGASVGLYARELRRLGFKGRIISFEPLPSAYQQLTVNAASDPAWETRRTALGASNDEATLLVASRETSSSLLEMQQTHLGAAPDSALASRQPVSVTRLDDLATELRLEGESLLLKLDVQGYEGEVLRGAERTLTDTTVLEVELSFVELYAGQPLFDEVKRTLESTGFALVDLEPVLAHPETGELLQVNGIFRRTR
jgi:FkbM family methyltransferase